MWYESSCSGSTASSEADLPGWPRAGRSGRWHWRAGGRPPSPMAIARPPRQVTSLMPLTISGTSSGPATNRIGKPLRHRRERSVLELGREHAFAVGVGDLLELQRAFQRDRVGGAVAQAVQVVPVVDLGGDAPPPAGRPSPASAPSGRGSASSSCGIAARQAVGQVQEGDHLVGEGLGGRDADLVAAAQRQAAGGGLGQRGADHVRQAEGRSCPLSSAACRALSTSLVSPDWLTNMPTSSWFDRRQRTAG